MTEMKMKNLKNLDQIEAINDTMDISTPTRCYPNASLELDTLIFRDSGALVFTGNFNLKVKKVYNYKDESSLCNYEFIIEGEDGEDAPNAGKNALDAKSAGNLNLELGTINGNIRIQTSVGNGGNGLDGIGGIDGGDGGDGFCGGNGGRGGDAEAGTDGGNGGDAPNVDIEYLLMKKGCHIYVNGEEVKKNCNITIKGGVGGKGGKSAEGGKGGKGGKGIDSAHNGSSGSDGLSYPGGKDGENGADGAVKIHRKPIEEVLNNFRGMYILDLSDEEEREYSINQLGGAKHLEKYKVIKEAINKSSLQSDGNESRSVKISLNESHISYLPQNKLTEAIEKNPNYNADTKLGTLNLNFNIDLYDADSPISDGKAASKWQFILVEVRTVNNDYPTGFPLIGQSFETDETYGGIVEFCSEIFETSYFEGTIVTSVDIKGIDPQGKYVHAVYNKEDKSESNKKNPSVTGIDIKGPKWKKEHDNGIIMLYGRTDELPIYSQADYLGGDYYSNAMKSGNKVSTLMPFAGTVTFGEGYELVGPAKPNAATEFRRPSLVYSNKAAEITKPDVVYQNDLTDPQKLYDLWTAQKCFQPFPGVVDPHVDFDLSLDRGDRTSKLDWHHDICGEADNHMRTVYMRGGFTYEIHKKGFPEGENTYIDINVMGITKENLETLNKNKPEAEKRRYYEFLEGSHIIYIPPINIYWGCLGKSVLLKTADGTLKTAESVKIGDRLLSLGGKIVTVDNIYTGREKTVYRLSGSGFETLMSGAHPVLSENGKGIAVRKLKAGDRIMTESGEAAEVLSVTTEPYNDTVYNFSFEGETQSVYIIADGIFAGDLNAQNEAPEEPVESEEDKENRQRLTEEMRGLLRELRSAEGKNGSGNVNHF